MATTLPTNRQRWSLFLQNVQLEAEHQAELGIVRLKLCFYGMLALTGLCLFVAVISGIADKPNMGIFTIELAIAIVQILCCYGVYAIIGAMGVVTGGIVPTVTNAINSLPFIEGLEAPLNMESAKKAARAAAYFGVFTSTPLWYIIAFQLRGPLPVMLTYCLLALGLKLLCYKTAEKWRTKVENFTMVMDAVGAVLTIISGILLNSGVTMANAWATIGQGSGPLGEFWAWLFTMNLFMRLFMVGLLAALIPLIILTIRGKAKTGAWVGWFAGLLAFAAFYVVGVWIDNGVQWAKEKAEGTAHTMQSQQVPVTNLPGWGNTPLQPAAAPANKTSATGAACQPTTKGDVVTIPGCFAGWYEIATGDTTLTATGEVDYGGELATPKGSKKGRIAVAGDLVPGLPLAALVVKVGLGGTPFVVKNGDKILAGGEKVYVAVNDSDCTNNSLAFTVTRKTP